MVARFQNFRRSEFLLLFEHLRGRVRSLDPELANDRVLSWVDKMGRKPHWVADDAKNLHRLLERLIDAPIHPLPVGRKAVYYGLWAGGQKYNEETQALEPCTMPPGVYHDGLIFWVRHRPAPERFEEWKADMRRVPGSCWDPNLGVWKVGRAGAQALAGVCARHGIHVPAGVKEILWGQGRENEGVPAVPAETVIRPPENVADAYSRLAKNGQKLYPHQVAGVHFMLAHKRVINADGMGVGKTAQAIMAAYCGGRAPVLVVCPKTKILDWVDDWLLWTGERAWHPEKNRFTPPAASLFDFFRVFVVNYEVLGKMAGLASRFRTVISDEAHRLKDGKTQAHRAFRKFSGSAEFVFLLTGTPIMNCHNDVFSLITLLGRAPEFGGAGAFIKRYGGNENSHELRLRLHNQNVMIRRVKESVLPDLPPKKRTVEHVLLSEAFQREYDACREDFGKWLAANGRKGGPETGSPGHGHPENEMQELLKLHYLRWLSGLGKVEAAALLVERKLDQSTETKVIVFAHHRETVKALCARFPNALKIDGLTPPEQRKNAVQRFQNDASERVIVCTRAAYEGVTLTAADEIVFLEYPWVPGLCDQAEDRAHRLGQRRPVTVTYVAGIGTVDRHILRVIDRKRKLFDAAIGPGETQAAHEKSAQREVLEEIRNEEIREKISRMRE